jgi:CYTH domain-containing protein
VEIERKFLLAAKPADLSRFPREEIDQGYLLWGDDGSEMRLRRSGARRRLTLKRGRGMVREEVEVDLTPEQFEALWPSTAAARVSKTRYHVACGEYTAELDCYHGRHEGLCLIEVEFSTESEARAFRPPVWFGGEVTDDPHYRSRAIAASQEMQGAAVA